jgi:hypothetical protein
MSSFADNLFQRMGVPVLMEYLGDRVGAYLTPRGGVQSGPFKAILRHQDTQIVENDAGQSKVHVQIVGFPRQDGLPFWSEVALIGLTVTIDSVAWAYELTESLSESIAIVKLVRRPTVEVARGGYRRK